MSGYMSNKKLAMQFDIMSYGTGNRVKLPGPSFDKFNAYEFEATTYDFIYKDLRKKDVKLYTQNGLLYMLDRNRGIKPSPQKFQKADEEFDIILCLEERVYDQVLLFLQNRVPLSGERAHVINIDIKDNPKEAAVGAELVTNLCQKLEESFDVDHEIDDILTDFEARNQDRNLINTVVFY
uniref:RNA polymerase II subunit A C-terminal domain phosphatase SSU72 n=1 Tax=Panagrolaimus sp. ES5 TaxID=591445 RepID=A0AC34GWN7_9BILA